MKTALTDLLDIDYPIIQAPMAGVSTPELAVAVANAGGLGSLAIGTMTAEKADAAIADLSARTNRPFNVNVFTHATPTRDAGREAAWLETLRPYFEEFEATPPTGLNEIYTSFNDDPKMLDVLLERRPSVVSFHFGLPPQKAIKALKDVGVYLFCTATTVSEAKAVAASGIDVVVAQGTEAGGHSGTFDQERTSDGLGLMALLPQIVRAVDIPVVAAGGIGNGAGIAAALALGAEGVQMGTTFISCPESAAGQAHHDALVGEAGHQTMLTTAISGRPARGIANRLMRDTAGQSLKIPDYPVAYDAGKAIDAVAKNKGNGEFSALWGGQAAPLNKQLPAAEVMATLVADTKAALQMAIKKAGNL